MDSEKRFTWAEICFLKEFYEEMHGNEAMREKIH